MPTLNLNPEAQIQTQALNLEPLTPSNVNKSQNVETVQMSFMW